MALVDGDAFEVRGAATLFAIAPGTSRVEVTITRESGASYSKVVAWTAAAVDQVRFREFFPSDGRLYALQSDSIDSAYAAFDADGNELAGTLPPFETESPRYQPEPNVLTIDVPDVVGQTVTATSPISLPLVVEAISGDLVTLGDFDDRPLQAGRRRALEATSRYSEHRVPGWPRFTGYTGTTCGIDVSDVSYLVGKKPGTCTLTIRVAYGQTEQRSVEITP